MEPRLHCLALSIRASATNSAAKRSRRPAGRPRTHREAPAGLYAELLSGTAFTMARSEARRAWLAAHHASSAEASAVPPPERQIAGCRTGCADSQPPAGTRWHCREQPTDFLDGLLRMAANAPGDKPAGVSIYQYLANRSMERCFYDADGDCLLVPQLGRLRL
ncbi:homogentisate 1,2-dioxygenase [Pseudomonas aeruginosa]|nr:homogentisate 1,2-dioxygenase [Pseudomonas aeruginosa]